MQRASTRADALPLEDTLPAKALYEEVAGRLRQRIFSQDLGPGTWIDEQALARAYGISRTPLREALKVLASEGLVILKPRHGSYVVQVSRRDVEEAFAVLAILESQGAYEAVEKATPEDLQRLEAVHEQLEVRTTANDAAKWFEINQEFHRVLQEMSGNRYLLHVVDNLRKVMKLARYRALQQEGWMDECLKEHRCVMAAIRRHDPVAVRECVHAHLLSCGQAIAEMHPSMAPPAELIQEDRR
jgi:DNA-binding GntR family transcriptional regulator